MHPVRTNAANAEKIKFLIIFNPFHCAIACWSAIIFKNIQWEFYQFYKNSAKLWNIDWGDYEIPGKGGRIRLDDEIYYKLA